MHCDDYHLLQKVKLYHYMHPGVNDERASCLYVHVHGLGLVNDYPPAPQLNGDSADLWARLGTGPPTVLPHRQLQSRVHGSSRN